MSEALSPASPIHSYSPGTLIYEINLSIPREKIDEYIAWLKEFTTVMNPIHPVTTPWRPF